MRGSSAKLAITAVFAALSAFASLAYTDSDGRYNGFEDDGHGCYDRHAKDDDSIQLGPRPFYLVKGMDDSDLKERLLQCKNGPFSRSDFSIGHRGAPLQFPEHTKESYEAAARMGAGIVECDVTFTTDKELVCRHSECDLHTTTNIVTIPELNQKCSVPYTGPGSSPKCCTSDLTLAEFKTLRQDGCE